MKRKIKFIKKDGQRVAVIRPVDPQKALALVFDIKRRQDSGEITREQAGQEFQDVPMGQDYVFIGYLAEVGSTHLIASAELKPVGTMEPGDSMVSELATYYLRAPQP